MLDHLRQKAAHSDQLGLRAAVVHDLPIAHWVKIQVPPLDHVHRMVFQKGQEGCNLRLGIGEAGQVQIIYRNKLSSASGHVNTFNHIVKAVALGSKIGPVARLPHTVHTRTDTIQACLKKPLKDRGKAGIGVHVDGALLRGLSDQLYGGPNHLSGQ